MKLYGKKLFFNQFLRKVPAFLNENWNKYCYKVNREKGIVFYLFARFWGGFLKASLSVWNQWKVYKT